MLPALVLLSSGSQKPSGSLLSDDPYPMPRSRPIPSSLSKHTHTHTSWIMGPIDEDILSLDTELGGTGLELTRKFLLQRLTNSHSICRCHVICQGRRTINSSTHIYMKSKEYNDSHHKISSVVQWWHLYPGGNKQLSNWT